ncbi:hypothetical protein BG004_000756, partial [Podila humilis]
MIYRKAKAEQNRSLYKSLGYSSSQISVAAGISWKKEPEDVKRQFETQADTEKLKYEQEGIIMPYCYRTKGGLQMNTSSSFSARTDSTEPSNSQSSCSKSSNLAYNTAPMFMAEMPALRTSTLPPQPPRPMTGMFLVSENPSQTTKVSTSLSTTGATIIAADSTLSSSAFASSSTS